MIRLNNPHYDKRTFLYAICLLCFTAVWRSFLSLAGIDEVPQILAWLFVAVTTALLLVFLYLMVDRRDGATFLMFAVSCLYRISLNVFRIYYSQVELTSDMLQYQHIATKYYYEGTSGRSAVWENTARVIGTFYKMYGLSRILFQCFSGSLILISALLIYRSLKRLGVSRFGYQMAVFWILFSPKLVIDSCNVHREALINVAVAFSVYYFLRWFQDGTFSHMLLSVLFSLFGATMHTGVIAITGGYMLLFILYHPGKNRFSLTSESAFFCVCLLFVAFILYYAAGDLFFTRFSGASIERIATNVDVEEGGSYYSIGQGVSNPLLFLLYTPVRTLYFYCSPMPWYWRGLLDVAAFLLSGAPYGYCFVRGVISARKKNGQYNCLIIALLVVFAIFGILFAWGVKTAGQAMRHRDKLLPVAACILALSLSNSPLKYQDAVIRCNLRL